MQLPKRADAWRRMTRDHMMRIDAAKVPASLLSSCPLRRVLETSQPGPLGLNTTRKEWSDTWSLSSGQRRELGASEVCTSELRATDKAMVQCLNIPTSMPTVLPDNTTEITTVGFIAGYLLRHVSNEGEQTITTTEMVLKTQVPLDRHVRRISQAARLSTIA